MFVWGLLFLAAASGAVAAEEGGSPLAAHVTIRRDTFGIPHILADSEEAAAFGFGYAQAEDHCVEIARNYISARGEQARYFGTGKEGDFVLKLYDNLREAAADLKRVSPLYRKMVSAYAAGFNRYVEQHRRELPDWIPQFTAVDVMADRRAGAVNAVFSQGTVRALREKYSGSAPVVYHHEVLSVEANDAENLEAGDNLEPPGSNAFALTGARTTSGKPILLGNPHLNWSSLYWEAQVTVPGKVNFFGSTLAGIPVLRAGFNERLGWVTTNNSPDLTDVFVLPLDPKMADHYLFKGKSVALKKTEVSIEIRNADGKLTSEKRTYWDSGLGKILYRDSGRAFAVRSSQIDACRYYEGFYVLSKSRNLKGFLKNMERNYVPTSNFTYADVDGNVLYMWNARIPERLDDGTNYRLDVPGDPKYVWTKLLKVAKLPHLLNPAGGYIQNCNNPPWYTSLRDPIERSRYPSYIEQVTDLALRPQLALEMLESQEKFSLEDVKRLKFNTRMLIADRVKPDLIKAIRAIQNPSDELRRGLAVMESWDNCSSAQSRGGVLFQRFWDTYSAAAKPQPFAVPWDAANPARTPSGLANPALAITQFEDAVRWTRRTYGAEDVAWGDVHRFRFGTLDIPGDGANGTYGAFRVVRFSQSPEGKQVAGQVKPDEPPVGFGDAWILAVEFSRPIVAYSVLAYGQTTHSASSHSSDQIRMYANHEYKRVWFSEAEIKANLEREYRP